MVVEKVVNNKKLSTKKKLSFPSVQYRRNTGTRAEVAIKCHRTPKGAVEFYQIFNIMFLGLRTRTSEAAIRSVTDAARNSYSAGCTLAGAPNLGLTAGSGAPCPERELKSAPARLTSGFLTPGSRRCAPT